jgi:transcriptional regulator with XRE-family HTH domain
MTQVEVAERGCVAVSVISQVERGRRQPSLVTLQRLVAGAGYAVEMRLFRPDPRHEQLVGPIGKLLLAHRAELAAELAELAPLGVRRIWVSGAVARGEETWSTRLVLIVEGLGPYDQELWRKVMIRVVLVLGYSTPIDLEPITSGSPDDVLLIDAPGAANDA